MLRQRCRGKSRAEERRAGQGTRISVRGSDPVRLREFFFLSSRPTGRGYQSIGQPLDMASVSSDNQDDTNCDKCGAPASWATSNLSWKQSLSHHLDTYLTSPRMWPIGYIVRSPYSPLRLELEMPAHNSWRDAFEDLLALETGGQMISLESRKKEAEVAKRLWHANISRNVSIVNDQLQFDARFMSLLKRIQHLAARTDQADVYHEVAEAIPAQEESTKQTIAAGKAMIADLANKMDKSLPASRYKMRGQWMASLVSSGALPGWEARTFDSSEGSQVSLIKMDGDPDDSDGQRMTEHELMTQFEKGVPMQLGSPSWSTANGPYPEPNIAWEEVSNGASSGYMTFRHFPLRPSILSQVTTVECTKSEKGIRSTKVGLKKSFTDGMIEQKEIVDDSSKVLEETEKVYDSMQARNAAVAVALREAQYDLTASKLEENDELD